VCRQRWLELQRRLGPANVFNPVVPDGEYVLDLRDCSSRLVAQVSEHTVVISSGIAW
jgi:hypothetical protein